MKKGILKELFLFRLTEFYEKKMKILKENYEAERPERILYDIEVHKALETLAENNGAISHGRDLTTFEEVMDVSYIDYLEGIKVGFIAFLQTLFVFVGHWDLVEKHKKIKK